MIDEVLYNFRLIVHVWTIYLITKKIFLHLRVCLNVSMYTVCMPDATGGQRRTSEAKVLGTNSGSLEKQQVLLFDKSYL